MSNVKKCGVFKCKRPSFKNINGRTWDYCDVILKDGTKVQGHLDTTWGSYFYFMYENQYYKGYFHDFKYIGSSYVNTFDLRTFSKENRA